MLHKFISVSVIFRSPFTGLFFTDTQEQKIIAESDLPAHLQKQPCCFFIFGRTGSKPLLMKRTVNSSQLVSQSRVVLQDEIPRGKPWYQCAQPWGIPALSCISRVSVPNLGLLLVCSALLVVQQHNKISQSEIMWSTIVFTRSDL